MLTNADIDLEFEPVRLGKKIELGYIPFSELAIPWNACPDAATLRQKNSDIRQRLFCNNKRIDAGSAKASRILKNADFNDLKNSIAQFGLLKPFEVAELQEQLDEKTVEKEVDCKHQFGCLRSLPKRAHIPEECLGCHRIIECKYSIVEKAKGGPATPTASETIPNIMISDANLEEEKANESK